jgi:hypothetical protein
MMFLKAAPRASTLPLRLAAVAPRFTSLSPRYVTTDAASSHAEKEHVPEVCGHRYGLLAVDPALTGGM